MNNSKKCVYCGVELPVSSQLYKRKYCSITCSNKYKLRLKKPDAQEKLWIHEPKIFGQAMEMYWSGASSATIARTLNIPVGTVYSWVHDFGGNRQRKEPLKKLLGAAKSAEEWLCALRDETENDGTSFESLTVSLVCGKHRGQSVNRFTAIIYEGLKGNLSNEKIYAFCNKCGNVITTIAYHAPIFNVARYVKTSGTFIWPDEVLGKTIEVTKAEFELLLFVKKHEKVCEKVRQRLILCGFDDIMRI